VWHSCILAQEFSLKAAKASPDAGHKKTRIAKAGILALAGFITRPQAEAQIGAIVKHTLYHTRVAVNGQE